MSNFLNAAWCEEDFHRLGVQNIKSLLLVDSLYPLDGGRRRERRKNAVGEEDFPRA
jgi:hypothetical protein